MTAAVLDTSALIAALRGEPPAVAIIRRLDQLVIPAVALGELLAGGRGARSPQRYRAIQRLVASPRVELAPAGAGTAERYAAIVDSLRLAGRPIPTNDIWIAASAMEHGLPVVTSDRHYLDVPQVLVELLAAR